MIQIRTSCPEDVPRQRELWQLAFGDDGAYVDNFYHTYYKPERMLLLEEEGVVQAMTAWFDTDFVVPGRGRYRAAYLYAVATHPEAQGRGLAGQLLSGADHIFQGWDIPAVTTVPAEPSLHRFFGRNGFRECFVDGQFSASRDGWVIHPETAVLERLSPKEYRDLRERLLAGMAHIDLPQEALAYQAGACALFPGGGLYALQTPHGRAALCAEGMECGELLVKELLCPPEDLDWVLERLPGLLPRWSFAWRTPGGANPFGMIKWLDPEMERSWNWASTAYLGLAFD
ncbi:MAG: GNAT family N-acetyltransferase [Oscillospiraceae bacterium]|nr:GNAT family N-acetyltransferase [Oscillospiraceae bacterium]